ncbi:MAG: ABC transporter permease [Chloroflexi bacterium]|nr:ABC transporter permease [Chloroflexota bacterium]
MSSSRPWLPHISLPTLIGIVLLAIHLIMAIGAPWLAPYPPNTIDTNNAFQAPSSQHVFGTDRYGRDILARVIYGGQVALVISLASAVLSVLLGGLIGVIVAYVGGIVDEITMRVIDAVISIPGILLLLVIVTGLGTGTPVIILAMVLSYMPGVIRVIRATVQEYVPRDFIVAARLRGERVSDIVWVELLPNILDVLCVEFAMRASWIVLSVSGLSFLGFGVNPPTPDWGLMVNENRAVLVLSPWGTIFPMIAVATLVVSLNVVSDEIAKVFGIDRGVRR